MRVNRLLSVLAGGTALTFVLAACGGGNSGAPGGAAGQVSAEQALSKISDQLDEMKSWKFTMDMSGPVAMSGTGAYRVSPLAMEMSFAKFDVGGQPVAGDIKMRMIDGVVYMSMDTIAEQLGAEWIKIDTAGTDQFKAISETFSQQDPRVQLRLFTSAAGGEIVGTETIDGVQTTHYSATLNAEELGEVSGLSESEVTAIKKSFSNAGIDKMTYNVWVDESFQPLQFKVGMPSATGDYLMTMRLTDVNSSVKISAPPSGDVVELPTS
ncbi:MAG: hypothetical protein L0Y54_14055 [Sporichthyaceae bacterium]|nr:hypothetical protein [Sporichthyaceae bacterium]